MQENHVAMATDILVSKSKELENTMDDLLVDILTYPLDPRMKSVTEYDIVKLKTHYNWSFYQALLTATKNSLMELKERIYKRGQVPNHDYLLSTKNDRESMYLFCGAHRTFIQSRMICCNYAMHF